MTSIANELSQLGVCIRYKSKSRLCRFIAFFLGAKFLTSFVTTLSPHTIWVPDSWDLEDLEPHRMVLKHELVYIFQARRWLLLWQLGYLFFPVPVFFAYARWRWERAAYMVNLRAGSSSIEEVVQTLHKNYFRPWPRVWMAHWFMRELLKEQA